MKIIGAGMSKTGTTSLAQALRILGFNVYDFDEQMTIHRKQWFDLYFSGVEPDFAAMYGADVDAITDSPSVLWFEEILKSFPDAKVVLTVRDSCDVWLHSHLNHLARDRVVFPRWYRVFPSARERMDFLSAVRSATYGSENPTLLPLYRKKYREHNERVQAVVPADQLLVFNVKQGWLPLCEFLGCEVPSQQFPRCNVGCSSYETANSVLLKKTLLEIRKEACILIAIAVGIICALISLVTQ